MKTKIILSTIALTLCSCFWDDAKEDLDELEQTVSEINDQIAQAEKTVDGLINDPELRQEALNRLNTLIPDSVSIVSAFAGEGESFEDKIAQLEEVVQVGSEIPATLEGMKHCLKGLPQFFRERSNPQCYGPTLKYNASTHPDAMANPPSGMPQQNCGENCELPAFDLGIWKEKEGEEACAAAKMNQLLGNAGFYSDLAMGSLGMMVCVAGFHGDTIPNLEALVLTDKISKIYEGKVLHASVQKKDAFFHTYFKAEWQGLALEFDVLHNAETKAGKMWVKTKNIQSAGIPQRKALAMQYKTSDEGRIVRIASAGYNRDNPQATGENLWLNAIDPMGMLNTDPSEWTDDFNVMTMRILPDKLNLSYGWQAGSMDGFLRVFNAKVEQGTGEAWFGYAPHNVDYNDIFVKLLTIDRMICNWAGPGNLKDGQKLVQFQSMALQGSLWVPVQSNIHYVPVNLCSMDTDPGTVFPEMTGQNSTHDLLPLAEYGKSKFLPRFE